MIQKLWVLILAGLNLGYSLLSVLDLKRHLIITQAPGATDIKANGKKETGQCDCSAAGLHLKYVDAFKF